MFGEYQVSTLDKGHDTVFDNLSIEEYIGDELVSMSPFFQHGSEAEISHSSYSPNFMVDQSSLGLDLKRTPEGGWELIEVTPLLFGVKGFEDAYHRGDIRNELGRHGVKFFQDLDHAMLEFEDKMFAADHLPSARSYDTVETFEGNTDSEIVFLKNCRKDSGIGVAAVQAGELEEKGASRLVTENELGDPENIMIEENVPSEGVEVEGRDYDACMRYVVDLSLDAERMTATHLGGYWRTAPEPKNSDASLEEKHIANYERGEAVKANGIQLKEAADFANQITAEIYSALIQQNFEGEIDESHAERYLPDISTRWKDDGMGLNPENPSENDMESVFDELDLNYEKII